MSNQQSIPSQTEVGSRDPLILAVDTSSPHASYAVACGEKLLATLSSEAIIPHSQTFFANLRELLKLANLETHQIDLFAAATGPGSFTGLRVGLAAVKGLAGTLKRPAIGINSIDLQALSAGVAGSVLVLIDAGRKEVYWGLRRVDVDGRIEVVGPDRVGRVSDLLDELEARLNSAVIVGTGAVKFQKEIEELAESRGTRMLISQFLQSPIEGWQLLNPDTTLATTLARYVSRLKASDGKPEIHAYYVRLSDAEIKR